MLQCNSAPNTCVIILVNHCLSLAIAQQILIHYFLIILTTKPKTTKLPIKNLIQFDRNEKVWTQLSLISEKTKYDLSKW